MPPAHTSAAAIASTLALVACVADGPQPPERAQPRDIPRPDNLPVATVGFAVDAAPEDTDRNGFFDTFSITAYLFPPQNRYPLAIHARGDITFTLSDDAGNTLATWRLDQNELEPARFTQLVGQTYRFDLSLLDADTKPNTDNPDRPPDRLAPDIAYLAMTYHPPDRSSRPVRAGKSLSVRVGPTGL